ncbi:CAMK protein kinase [Blastocystis sp. subtype 4]|uniref:CAMK protein kinase n=1 Tax=Blastocystis sp. subtype 4 TaxID=944170 RepID=UPI000711F585|nr:CAMK protein kinase [Blastocystis sp. subtype 4]KNB45011.1 CAMK protein kinase [Blastocystis sp. subtype 4]|eukprot:XP_014528454.1 CAMK protein kinase [Blastocystis sp. subtype 4]
MVAGYLPFDEPSLSTLFRRIQTANYTCPAWFSDQLKDLLAKILVPDPLARLSLFDITQHPWYLGDDLRSEAILSPRSPPHELSANEEAKERVKKASTFVAPKETIFGLFNMAIQRSISPITSLLVPRLPANVILTSSPPSLIYSQIMDACRDHNWGVTTDRANGVFFIAMKIVEFVSVVEIHVSEIGEKQYMIRVMKKDYNELDGYLQVERDLTSRLIRYIPDSHDIGLNNRAVTINNIGLPTNGAPFLRQHIHRQRRMKTYVYFFLSLLVTAGAIFYAEKTSPSSLGVFYSFSMSKAFVPVVGNLYIACFLSILTIFKSICIGRINDQEKEHIISSVKSMSLKRL